MFAWEGVPERVKPYVEEGEPGEGSPKELAAVVKRAAGFFGSDLTGICRRLPVLTDTSQPKTSYLGQDEQD